MKTTSLLLLLAATPCMAGPPAGGRAGHHLDNPGPRLLAMFDADKDGKLSDAEKAKAREAIKARAGHAKERLRPHVRERVIKRFDEDGDGKLNESERAKAKAALREFLQGGASSGTP
jgi:hypothetical protein